MKRTHRHNDIPKGAALKLAKILSWKAETEWVEADGVGVWSNEVSHIARDLGLVRFDGEGVYAGYSSTESSFPDNEIDLDEKAFATWLAGDALAKERAILVSLLRTTESEFFHGAALVQGARFDQFGCATGPASRMDLPKVRRGLLEVL